MSDSLGMQAELEAAIARSPDDPSGYLVYADWLQQHGDPRGSLIALQQAEKAEEAAQLLADHGERFWGPLVDAQDLTKLMPSPALAAPTAWRWGFLHSLWISNKPDRNLQRGGKPRVDVAALLGDMLEHPSARFLRKLAVGIVTYESNHYDDVIAAIARRPRPLLHTLVLGDFYYEETELNWSTIGDAQPLYAAVPELRSLTLRSGSMTIGAIDLPHLESLTVITGGLDKDSARAVADASWPSLHTLSLQLGRGGLVTVDHLANIFAGTKLPRLRHLGLGNAQISDDIAQVLADSPIAAQLEELDFSDGTLGDEGALALVAAKARFPALRSIDVSSCYLTDAGLEALATLCTVFSGEQRDDGGDPEDRYINAYE